MTILGAKQPELARALAARLQAIGYPVRLLEGWRAQPDHAQAFRSSRIS